MKAKFKLGDKVRFTERIPFYSTEALRKRTRTVVGKLYDPHNRCTYYELASKGKGRLGVLFRSYMLSSTHGRSRAVGRPRKKLRGRPKLN